jgi:hypothetical protein
VVARAAWPSVRGEGETWRRKRRIDQAKRGFGRGARRPKGDARAARGGRAGGWAVERAA